MRFIIITVLLTAYFSPLAQNYDRELKGKVSYKNSQSVYVRFENTKGLQPGDTLFIRDGDTLTAALVVNQLSSISCVTSRLGNLEPDLGSELIWRATEVKPVAPVIPASTREPDREIPDPDNDMDRERLKEVHPELRGKIAVGSYTNFNSSRSTSTQRMRYTFSLEAKNINQSRFSVESYAIFRHTANQWDEVSQNLANALKVYNLAIHYSPDDQMEITIGRKINRRMSNVGAIDGIQVSRRLQNFSLGAIVGTRPDNIDYSLNLNLLQYGGFLAHDKTYQTGSYIQTTLAAIEQKYYSKTDRRFVYLQHSNSIVKNLNLFGSVEIDLLEMQDQKLQNSLRPTSIFLSLHYRVSRKLSISSSYDARKNVIYYESFKNFIDQLIDQESRQGARVRFTYRPIKYLTIGSSGGYRFQKDQQNTSKNLYGFLSISRIPWVRASATLSTTFLESNYLKGLIHGVVLNKDIAGGKILSELNLRKVNYQYGQYGSTLEQNIVALGLSGKITRNLSISTNYEVTFEKGKTLHRIYSNIIQRF